MDHTNGRKRLWTWTGERDSFLNSVQSCLFLYAAKLSPQEQFEVAFGLVTLNPPFCRSSLKSRVEPLTNNALLGSTTIRTLEECTRTSRGAGPSTRSILYCRPEQPPPITARRKAPSGRPCFSSRELRRRAAFSVTRINFSLPILIPVRSGLAVRAGAAVSWGVVSLTNL